MFVEAEHLTQLHGRSFHGAQAIHQSLCLMDPHLLQKASALLIILKRLSNKGSQKRGSQAAYEAAQRASSSES